MSSISPMSDQAALQSYYLKAYKDLQDNKEAELNREQTHHARELDHLESKQKETLNQKDKETDLILNNMRNQSSESVAREKLQQQDTVNLLKDSVHSKMLEENSKNTNQEKFYRAAIDQLQHELEEQKQIGKNQTEAQVSSLAENQKKELQKRDETGLSAKANIEDTMNRDFATQKELYQNEIDRLKAQNYNNRGQISASVPLEVFKKQIQDLNDSNTKALERYNTNSFNQEVDAKTDLRDEIQKYNNKLENLTNKHGEDLSDYREKIKTISNYATDENKHKSELIARDLLDAEKAHKTENQRMSEAYREPLERLKNTFKENENYYNERERSALKTKDEKASAMVSSQNAEQTRDVAELQSAYLRSLEQYESLKKLNEASTSSRIQNATDLASQTQKAGLENQAKNYESTIENQHKLNESDIHSLQKALYEKTHSTDISSITPALEAKIRQNLIQQYEKNLGTEIDRNKLNQEHMREQLGDDYTRAKSEAGVSEMRIRQQNELDRALERTQYYDSIGNTEKDASVKARDSDSAHEREIERMSRQFTYNMERQKRDYESMIEVMRSESESKISAIRQDDSLAAMSNLRSYSTKQNELIQEYDKKLVDQRTEYDFKIDDLKNQFKTEFSEIERRSKQDLENQAKGYEQRVSQLEAQNKEHERYIAQNYQEQLDKSRRAYELISQQKKS